MTEFERQVAQILGVDEKETSPLSETEVRGLYTAAYGHYEKGEYRAAGQLFTRLILSNPFSEDFWQGLAGAKQMSRDYEAALHAWALVSLLNESNPWPHFHAAECFLRLEQKEDALKALALAEQYTGSDAALSEKIQGLKAL